MNGRNHMSGGILSEKFFFSFVYVSCLVNKMENVWFLYLTRCPPTYNEIVGAGFPSILILFSVCLLTHSYTVISNVISPKAKHKIVMLPPSAIMLAG